MWEGKITGFLSGTDKKMIIYALLLCRRHEHCSIVVVVVFVGVREGALTQCLVWTEIRTILLSRLWFLNKALWIFPAGRFEERGQSAEHDFLHLPKSEVLVVRALALFVLNLNFGDPRRSGLGLSDRHARLHGASERPEKLLYTSFLTQGWVKLALIYLINIKKMFLKMILKKGEKKANFESVGSVLVPVLPQKGDITHHECPLLSDTNSSPFFF